MKCNLILLVLLLSAMSNVWAENDSLDDTNNSGISKMTPGEEKIEEFKKTIEARCGKREERTKTIAETWEKHLEEMRTCSPEKHPMLDFLGIEMGSPTVLPPEKRVRITLECMKDLPQNLQVVSFLGPENYSDFIPAGLGPDWLVYCYFSESEREYSPEYPPDPNVTITISYALSEHDARYRLAGRMNWRSYWTPQQFEEDHDQIARAYNVRTDCEIGNSLYVSRSTNIVGNDVCFVRDCIVFSVAESRTTAGKIDLPVVAKWLDSKYLELNRTSPALEADTAEILTGRGRKKLYFSEVLDYVYAANMDPATTSVPNIIEVFGRSKPPFDLHVVKVQETPANVEQNGWFLAQLESTPGHYDKLINTYDFPCYEVQFTSPLACLTLQITQCDSLRSARYVLFDTLVSTTYPRLHNGKFYMTPTSKGPPCPPFAVCREKAIGDDITLFYTVCGRVVRFIRNHQVFVLSIEEDWRNAPSDFDFLAFAKWIDKQFTETNSPECVTTSNHLHGGVEPLQR